MQVMTLQKIKELKAEFSRVLTLEDFELIARLDKAADLVVNGVQVADSSLFAYPLYVAKERFTAPTIGKEMYWREQVIKHVEDDLIPAAQFWILTFDEVPELRGKDIQKAVLKWARKCNLNSEDAEKVRNYYMPDEPQEAKNKEDNKYGALIGLLIREYGENCKHWLNADNSEIEILLADWTAQQEAKAREFRKAKGGSRNQVAPAASPKFVMLHKFNLIVAEIKREWGNPLAAALTETWSRE